MAGRRVGKLQRIRLRLQLPSVSVVGEIPMLAEIRRSGINVEHGEDANEPHATTLSDRKKNIGNIVSARRRYQTMLCIIIMYDIFMGTINYTPMGYIARVVYYLRPLLSTWRLTPFYQHSDQKRAVHSIIDSIILQ